ncbi:PP0621 family protein [Rhodoferax sp. GW822-FHT02A01]|uniref:PP0621 family protein n=1 Tax=Rhodoferax sp. GW822-FHT02A01 TaxID=3141537 RepID=UPI00315CF6F6
MKFLLLFFIFMVFAFQWRHSRANKVNKAVRKSAPPPGAAAMVVCAHCGVHLPATEAVHGAQAVYCSAAHRLAREP